MIGGFEPEAKPAFVNHRQIPDDWNSILPIDWDHFSGCTCEIPTANLVKMNLFIFHF